MPNLILVADDNPDNILLLKRVLRRTGLELEILEANSGRDTIRLAIDRLPELILLDMKMPDMDGYQTAAALRGDETTENIPIVAVTAQAMLGDREKAIEAGCSEYVTKPIDAALLTETVKRYLAKK